MSVRLKNTYRCNEVYDSGHAGPAYRLRRQQKHEHVLLHRDCCQGVRVAEAKRNQHHAHLSGFDEGNQNDDLLDTVALEIVQLVDVQVRTGGYQTPELKTKKQKRVSTPSHVIKI